MLIEPRAGATGTGPSFYVCRYLPDVVEARYLFRAAHAREEAERFPEVDFPAFVEELARTIRRLHDAGIWHRDLSGGNVLLRFGADRRPAAVYLVDLNRARLGRPAERLPKAPRPFAPGVLPARAPGAAAGRLLGLQASVIPPQPLRRLPPRVPLQERREEAPAWLAGPGEAAPPAARHPRPHPRGSRGSRSPGQDRLGPPLGPAAPARRPTRQDPGAPGRRPRSSSGSRRGRRRPAAHPSALQGAPAGAARLAGGFRRHGRLPPALSGDAGGSPGSRGGAGSPPRAAAPPSLGRGPRRRGGARAPAPRPRLRADLRPAAEPRAGPRSRPLVPRPGGDRSALRPLRPALPGGAGHQPQQVGGVEHPGVRSPGADRGGGSAAVELGGESSCWGRR